MAAKASRDGNLGMMAKKKEAPSRKLINEYIWKRYIDNTSNYPDVEDKEALDELERFYAKHPVNEDQECVYYGVLLFEMAWQTEDKPRQAQLIVKAKEVLEIYRRLTEETDWDVVEDRLEECREFISENALAAAPKKPAAAAKPVVVDGMILISAGKFLFGAEGEEKFLEAFYIDTSPVSNAEYRAFIEDCNYRKPRSWDENPELAGDDFPVVGVSWMDALQYCQWSKKELPTEEQWEKAARGVDGWPYPWGKDRPTTETANFLNSENGAVGLQPLKGFEANRSQFGCRFTVGHVWEWTSTTYEGEARNRVLKGGSWADPDNPTFLSAYARLWATVKEKSELIGFRCARPARPA